MSHGVVPFDVIGLFTKRSPERARLMRHGEVIPAELEAGFDILGQLDPNWVWVLDIDGKIEGVLVASECHGAAMLWRVSISPVASKLALARLLRAFLRDARKRGLRGYLTFLSMKRENERRLAAIMKHSGGIQVGEESVVMMASAMPREGI